MTRKATAFPLETLFKLTRDLKKKGKKIVFTHGAFDLFHLGHLDLLQKSADRADFFIVSVESDQNISQYKDYRRPIIGEKARMEIVNELNCVSGVFINKLAVKPEDYIYLYKNLHLDYVTVGPRFEHLEELKFQAAKAQVKLNQVGIIKQGGTSAIIRKILKKYL